MRRLVKLTLVFCHILGIFIDVVSLFIVKIIFNLAQIFIILFFVFLNNDNVIASSLSVRRLTSLVSAIEIKIILKLT